MFKNSARRTLLTGALLAGASLSALYGCSENKSTSLEPLRGQGPLASKNAFPGLDAGAIDLDGPTPLPVALPPGFWNSIADVNNDGLFDIFIAYTNLNLIKLYVGINDKDLQLSTSIAVASPRDVAAGDLNGDGAIDVAAYSSAGNTVSIFTNNGDNTFTLAAVRTLPGNPAGVVVGDYDDDGVGDVYFCTSNPDLCWIIRDSNDGYAYTKLITPAAVEGRVELQTAASCGDEPDCDPHPGDGIQECMRAATCRGEKCVWAACVLYTNHWWQYPRYVLAVEACAAVFIVENALCLPTQLIPKGKLAGPPVRVPTGGGVNIE